MISNWHCDCRGCEIPIPVLIWWAEPLDYQPCSSRPSPKSRNQENWWYRYYLLVSRAETHGNKYFYWSLKSRKACVSVLRLLGRKKILFYLSFILFYLVFYLNRRDTPILRRSVYFIYSTDLNVNLIHTHTHTHTYTHTHVPINMHIYTHI